MCGDLARPTWRDLEELKPDPDHLDHPLYAVLVPSEDGTVAVELARPFWKLDQDKGIKYIVWQKKDGERVYPSHWMMLPDLEGAGYDK